MLRTPYLTLLARALARETCVTTPCAGCPQCVPDGRELLEYTPRDFTTTGATA